MSSQVDEVRKDDYLRYEMVERACKKADLQPLCEKLEELRSQLATTRPETPSVRRIVTAWKMKNGRYTSKKVKITVVLRQFGYSSAIETKCYDLGQKIKKLKTKLISEYVKLENKSIGEARRFLER